MQSVVRLLLWNRLERRNRFVDNDPRQFVFKPDRFLWRERRRIVERCNRHIDVVRIFGIFKKQMRAATCGKRANPIRVRNLARFTVRHDNILTRHCPPCHIGRARAFLAINAVTIDQCNWPALQHVSCPAANTPTSDLHTILLPEQLNQETTNRANGTSEIEGKVARVSGEEVWATTRVSIERMGRAR